MKEKNIKKRLVIPLIAGTLATFLFASASFAHGPETYKSKCTETNLDAWYQNAGPCDPDNPHDISAGIINEEGNSTANYPNGLCYPSFNNYIDYYDEDFYKNYEEIIGMDPYGSTPPVFEDERNFFKVRKHDEEAEWEDFKDTIVIDDGDELTFMVYIHNNGDSCFNDGANLPSGKFYSDWNTTSHNTTLGISPFFTSTGGELSKTIEGMNTFSASIDSDDAANQYGVIGAAIKDNVTLMTKNGAELILNYIEGSAEYTDYDGNWDYDIHEITNPEDLFSFGGTNLSTLKNGDIKGDKGDYYACDPYIGVVTFRVEVTTPLSLTPKPEECSEILVDYPKNIYENSLSWFRAKALDTQDDIYEKDIKYWVEDDNNGEPYGVFFPFDPGFTPVNPSPHVYEVTNVGSGSMNSGNFAFSATQFAFQTFAQATEFQAEFQEAVAEEVESGTLDSAIFGQNNTFNIDALPQTYQSQTVPFSVNATSTFANMAATVGQTSLTVENEDNPQKVYFWAYNDSAPAKVVHIEVEEVTYGPDETITPQSQEKSFNIDNVGEFTQTSVININSEDILEVETTEESATASDALLYGVCHKSFPIVGSQCEAIKVTNALGVEYGTILNPIYPSALPRAFKAESEDTIGGTFPGQIKYTVGSAYGCFSKSYVGAAMDLPLICRSTITADANETVWLRAEQPGQNVIRITQTGTLEPDCTKWLDIEQARCKDLGLVSTPSAPIALESLPATLELTNPVDIFGNPLPDTTTTVWTYSGQNHQFLDETGTTFAAQADLNTIDDPTYVTFQQDPATTTPITAGTITVRLSLLDPAYSIQCTEEIDVVEEALVCVDIDPKVIEYGQTNEETNLDKGTWYDVTTTTAYTPNPPTPDTVTYTADTTAGVFVADALVPSPCDPTIYPTGEDVIATPVCGAAIGSVTVDAGTRVYFVTYDNITSDITDALEIQATGRSEAECYGTYNLTLEEEVCQSLDVNYYPTPFDPTTETAITVQEGDFGDYTGDFEFSATGNGIFYTPGNEANGTNPATFTQAESASGILYSGGADGDVITIEAVEPNTLCVYQIGSTEEIVCKNLEIVTPSGTWTEDDFTDDDEQKFKIEVTTSPTNYASNFEYLYEVDDEDAGDWSKGSITSSLINYLEDIDTDDLDEVEICALDPDTNKTISACCDTKKFKEEDEDEPEFEKSVYDTGKKSWRDIVNIGGKTNGETGWTNPDEDQYVTYKVEFEPGSAKSAEIWESKFKNGVIESTSIIDGEFTYQGMIIAIDGDAGKYIIYKSSGFDEDRYNDEKIGGDELSDYDNFDEDDDWYEDNYKCGEEKSSEICLDQNFDDIDEDFSDGEPLRFDKTDRADNVYILYQVENNTVITDELCKELVAKVQGCGERFDNEAKYEAYVDRDFDDQEWEGEDDARVVVICPFILTREGGDTFFHDEVETGSDVSECSEVDNTPVIIRRTPYTPSVTPSTGQGETEETTYFSTPSHDVCKLSNTTATGIPEYSNVFKNFSSSVCEMEADVATEWTETYINQAIENNVYKISKWGASKSPVMLSSMSSLASNFSNLGSGVFVVDGKDLTINANGEYKIKETSEVPAAQTYIVKNANLIIKSDIVYDDSNSTPVDPSSIPSAAFIVLNGNIEISNDVTTIDGILMAVDTEENGNGQIKTLEEETEYKNILTIRGSLIGDVYDLFLKRRAIGDPTKDEGSITIRYDERLLLNTPPGLNELIDITQLRVAD